MNTFTIIAGIILYGLTFICFLIPFRNGHRQTGYLIGAFLGAIVTLTFIVNLEFLTIFIWPLLLILQIIFISYWALKAFNKKKAAKVFSIILTIGFLLLILQPWISDWTFSKKDAEEILRFHNIELKDDYEILKNEAGGFRDYHESFTLKISDFDFNRITEQIKSSPNFKGYFTDLSRLPSADYKTKNTVEYETLNHINREFWTDKSLQNGTYYIIFQLDKQEKELRYIGYN